MLSVILQHATSPSQAFPKNYQWNISNSSRSKGILGFRNWRPERVGLEMAAMPLKKPNGEMAKLVRVTSVRTTCHFQTQDCPLLKGTASFLGNHIEKNICKLYCTCSWGKMVILPPAVPTSSMYCLSRKRRNVCKITSPLEYQPED